MGRKSIIVLPTVQKRLNLLGENIRLARLRRRLTASQLSERAGIARQTLFSIEHGDPNVSIGAYANVLLCLGLDSDLENVAKDDTLGRKIQDARLTTTNRAPRVRGGNRRCKRVEIFATGRLRVRNAAQRVIEVWADWQGLPSAQKVGTLFAAPSHGKEVFSFEYDRLWLEGEHRQVLDPSLRLYGGPQYPSEAQVNFGIFLDSAPDRWGRFLMQRREAQAARVEGRVRRPLLESDFLLGVYDGNRVGALRFRAVSDGPFMDDDALFAAPPWASLRDLEYASYQVERPGAEREPDYTRWIQMLVAPGGSLGGARPKAGIRDEQERLWIAKFPSSQVRKTE